jgi:hypothetical protein
MSADKYGSSELDETIESGGKTKMVAVSKAEPAPIRLWADLYDD